MHRLLRSLVVLGALLPALLQAAELRILVAGAAKAGVESLLPAFERLQLGIRAQLAPKLTVLPTGTDVLQGVAAGKFDIGVSQSSEILPVAGVVFVGGLPPPFDLRTPYAIAVVRGSETGRRLMQYLDAAAARAQFGKSGFSSP